MSAVAVRSESGRQTTRVVPRAGHRVVAGIVVARGGPPPPALLPGATAQRVGADPLAWTPARSADYASRAAEGLAHVLYAKSPGGMVASARRTARWRPLIERVARASR